jgi:DNA segregation ATPase FtsK/SpoIIIE-like protein
MATRSASASNRSSSSRSSRPAAVRRRRSKIQLGISPEVVRWIVGLALQLIGVTFLIGLFVQGGLLTDIERNTLAPWFGTPRWLLPPLFILLGYYLERVQGEHWDWELTLLGSVIGFLSLLGLVSLFEGAMDGRRPSGGDIGRGMDALLTPLVTVPGTAVILSVLLLAGVLLALDMSIPAVAGPLGRLVSRALGRLFRPTPEVATGGLTAVSGASGASSKPGKAEKLPKGDAASAPVIEDAPRFLQERPGSIPAPVPNPAPTSSTFAPSAGPGFGGSGVAAPGSVVASGVVSAPGGVPARGGSVRDRTPARGPEAPGVPADLDENAKLPVEDTGDQMPLLGARPEYHLPPVTLLEDIAARNGDSTMDHERNAAIIAAKLGSFNIPARVATWNAGPVVTQYEVEPAPEIKVSRIEALADDLSMALAARTIRIEAPIPGKSVVGIEIPNKDFNIVALRRILEEVDFRAASKLTFALGRDVAGHARAADLAKMPHLLIAGATGSGKSVMVNALITSLLCNSTPDEVRMVLMDLKRVELSAYNGLPHLMVPVITEPERAKAALKWAVAEMENRYRRFAGANARNIAGFNETRADPADRMNYLVIIIDELADLMMREGKNVEDPIVRLAQKARATGIHMVLATQRPSVNVVTGLIKANFPSRIAFAMASQIDSRTILDMPGAEDLIGRGDMLFQPADLPRPIRLQGVYVSDKEIANVTEHWRAEAEPHYDLGIVDSGEETSETDEEPDDDADRLLPDAIGVVQEYDRASASLLQRRLKIGYARAARIIDQLEARGYIGPFDGSNARQVLRRDGISAGFRGEAGEDET